MTVEELVRQLQEHPPYYEVLVDVIVGGDIGTDAVDIDTITSAGHHAPFVLITPAPDEYDVRGLIRDGLAAREGGHTP